MLITTSVCYSFIRLFIELQASYKAFVEGLFGDRAYEDIKIPGLLNNNLTQVRLNLFI